MKAFKSFIFLSFILFFSCSSNKDSDLTIGVSVTLEQSGLAEQLTKQFTQEHGLSIIRLVAAAGNVPTLLREQKIDTAITPIITTQLDKSLSYLSLFSSDYFIAGDKSDQAHIKLSLTIDEAIKKITHTQSKWIAQNPTSDVYEIEQQWLSKNKLVTETTTENQQQLIDKAKQLSAYFLMDKPSWEMIEEHHNSVQLFSEEGYLQLTYGAVSLKDNKDNEALRQWNTWLAGKTARSIIAGYSIKQQPLFTIIQ